MWSRYMVKTNTELREKRKQWFCDMEQKLHESWSSKEDCLFYYHSSEVFNPCIIAVPSLEGLQIWKEDDYFSELTSLTFVTTRQN